MKSLYTTQRIKILYFVLSLLFPSVSFAALGGLTDLLNSTRVLINLVIPVIFGIAIIFFFWGTAQFILEAGNEKTRAEGKQKMLWGIIALFVMVSIYGIIHFIGSAVGIEVSGGQ